MIFNHLRALVILIGISTLPSCISVPAIAKTEKGEIFMGKVTATPINGSYSMTSEKGNTISGSYNPWDLSKSRTFNFKVSDGRTGRVMVNSITDTSGYGFGRLSDGERCKFMYGQSSVRMNFSPGF